MFKENSKSTKNPRKRLKGKIKKKRTKKILKSNLGR